MNQGREQKSHSKNNPKDTAKESIVFDVVAYCVHHVVCRLLKRSRSLRYPRPVAGIVGQLVRGFCNATWW